MDVICNTLVSKSLFQQTEMKTLHLA